MANKPIKSLELHYPEDYYPMIQVFNNNIQRQMTQGWIGILSKGEQKYSQLIKYILLSVKLNTTILFDLYKITLFRQLKLNNEAKTRKAMSKLI